MRKNFQNIGFYPQPVLVIGTYDENGTPDAMNVGWGGLVGSVYVELNISEGHKTTANLRKKGAFTVSFADQAHLVEADYVGLVSGNTTPDKIARAGLHPLKSEFVDAPLFEEFPLTLECEVAEITDGPGGLRVIGRVVNMSADESSWARTAWWTRTRPTSWPMTGSAASTASWAAWSVRPITTGRQRCNEKVQVRSLEQNVDILIECRYNKNVETKTVPHT